MTLWNKVKFRNLDYIGDGVDFLMNNTPRFQTNLGAVFTLGMIVAGLVLGIDNLKSMFTRDTPIQSMSNYFETNFGFNASGNYHLMFSIHNRGNKKITDQDKYVKITPYLYRIEDASVGGKSGADKLNTFNCNDSDYFKKNWGQYADKFKREVAEERFNRSTCLDLNQTIIFKNIIGDVPNHFIDVFVEKCINSTTSDIVCKPIEEINDQLQDSYFTLTMMDVYFDGLSYEEPGVVFVRQMTFAASSEFYKRHYIDLNKVDYLTDKGIMLNEIKNQSYTQIKSLTFDGDLKDEGPTPGSFAEVTFRFSNVKMIYNRSYIKIPGLLANLGGFISAIRMIAYAINYFIAKKLYFLELFDQNFNEDAIKNLKEAIKKRKSEI